MQKCFFSLRWGANVVQRDIWLHLPNEYMLPPWCFLQVCTKDCKECLHLEISDTLAVLYMRALQNRNQSFLSISSSLNLPPKPYQLSMFQSLTFLTFPRVHGSHHFYQNAPVTWSAWKLCCCRLHSMFLLRCHGNSLATAWKLPNDEIWRDKHTCLASWDKNWSVKKNTVVTWRRLKGSLCILNDIIYVVYII